MAKKLVSEFTPIQNKALKNVTYCKRKRGLIKKAMELSMLCEQQISLVIYDQKKNKIVSYCSTGFTHFRAADLHKLHTETQNNKLETYNNQQYEKFLGN